MQTNLSINSILQKKKKKKERKKIETSNEEDAIKNAP